MLVVLVVVEQKAAEANESVEWVVISGWSVSNQSTKQR